MLYRSHLEEIKNLQQQDILHIIFSKAMQCLALQVFLFLCIECAFTEDVVTKKNDFES